VISRRACVLFKREKSIPQKPLRVDPNKCNGCRLCLGLGCPPIAWKKYPDHVGDHRKIAEKQQGIAVIDPDLCNGCGLCRQLCKSGAIAEVT
jgi:indolepyruvate ferredoxin oxidoreductase alpha subunit